MQSSAAVPGRGSFQTPCCPRRKRTSSPYTSLLCTSWTHGVMQSIRTADRRKSELTCSTSVAKINVAGERRSLQCQVIRGVVQSSRRLQTNAMLKRCEVRQEGTVASVRRWSRPGRRSLDQGRWHPCMTGRGGDGPGSTGVCRPHHRPGSVTLQCVTVSRARSQEEECKTSQATAECGMEVATGHVHGPEVGLGEAQILSFACTFAARLHRVA